MTSRRQKTAVSENIQKSPGRKRQKPGESGEGNWFRIVVRPKEEFTAFRYHDVGEKGGDAMRLAGKRSSGSWDTQSWLISKRSAHIEDEELFPDSDDAREIMENLGSVPKHIKGDIFEAYDRLIVPEREKLTKAQKKARLENIQKAQEARWGVIAHRIRK